MTGMNFNRVIWIVLDSVGIGEMPDAVEYGDEGSDTLGNLAVFRKLNLPNLCRLGLANIKPLHQLEPAAQPVGCFGRCALASPGKDTTTGHWEMVGVRLEKPFPLYPAGFPPIIMDEFTRRIGRGYLGNVPASGTEIIKDLGPEHVETGHPIVYTSADSVFQVAAHEEVSPIAALCGICETARSILKGPHEVGRVIARPFVGSPGSFVRTSNRRDYAVAPPMGMLLDKLADNSVGVHAVGKISEIFLGRGIRACDKTKSNADGMAKTLAALDKTSEGLIFTNLVDFDMVYGHRNDAQGYASALEAVDRWLPELMNKLTAADLLILTADHGCDPTTPSTDHSREYVPLLVYAAAARRGVNLGLRPTLADMGQTVAHNFGVRIGFGASFLQEVA